MPCAILLVEIPAYAARPVAEQLLCKQRLNVHVAGALEGLAAAERIVLDTGAGIAVGFLSPPHTALRVLRRLLGNIARNPAPHVHMPLHGAINLGPVRLASEPIGQVNVVGDGIDVAQRLLAFAEEGQILLARAFVEAVLARECRYSALFRFQGQRTDAHVRDHEVFELDLAGLARTDDDGSMPATDVVTTAARTACEPARRFSVAGAFAALALAAFSAALAFYFHGAGHRPQPSATARTAGVPASPGARAPLPAAVTPAPVSAMVRRADEPVPPTKQQAKAATPAAASAHRAKAGKAGPAVPAVPAERSQSGPAAEPAPVEPRQEIDPSPRASRDGSAPAPRQATGAGALSAVVTLAISPWGEVFVDGRSVGVSPPLREFQLAPGRHRLVVRNGELKPYERELEVTSNQSVRVKYKFAPNG